MLYKVIKFFLAILIIYELWFKEAFDYYAVILYGTSIIPTVLVIYDIIRNNWKIPFFSFVSMLFVYGIYSFLSGALICPDYSWFCSIMLTYFSFSMVCFDFCYVSLKVGSSEWLLNVFLVTALLCAVHTIFFGSDYLTEVVVRTLSDHNNPNFLGQSMVVGLFALVSKQKYVIDRFWITMTIALVFLYTILLTGSRKSLFCAFFLLLLWVVTTLRAEKGISFRRIFIFLAIVVAITIVVLFFQKEYSGTAISAKMEYLNSGIERRLALYQESIRFWESSPLVGIGFAQFQILSSFQYYSHSTYAEVLSCTGLIGVLIFFPVLFYHVCQLARRAFRRDDEDHYDYMMCFVMMLIELILGFGQIFIYNVLHLLILSYLATSVGFIKQENDLDRKISYEKGRNYHLRRFLRKYHSDTTLNQ